MNNIIWHQVPFILFIISDTINITFLIDSIKMCLLVISFFPACP